MATFSKVKLSGCTDGKQIKITSSGSGSAITIHTAVSGNTDWDEIWIYCANSSSTSVVKLTLLWGGTASPDDEIEVTIPAEGGLVLVVPGLILQNSLVVKAFAGTANVLLISGFVNRITG
jgi:hypothetical protein